MEADELTLSELMARLKKEGYTAELTMKPQFLECRDGELLIHPSEFHVDKVFRFEGSMTPTTHPFSTPLQSTDTI